MQDTTRKAALRELKKNKKKKKKNKKDRSSLKAMGVVDANWAPTDTL